MKLNLKKQFSKLALVTSFAATASMSLAGECRVAEASTVSYTHLRAHET